MYVSLCWYIATMVQVCPTKLSLYCALQHWYPTYINAYCLRHTAAELLQTQTNGVGGAPLGFEPPRGESMPWRLETFNRKKSHLALGLQIPSEKVFGLGAVGLFMNLQKTSTSPYC